MNADWQEIRLGDLFKVKHGFAFKGEFFTDEVQPCALVTPGNFAIGGGFQTQKQKYYRGPVPDEYILRPGVVVVTMTDLSKQSDTLGYAALVPDDGTTWLHNQRVGLLEFLNSNESDPIFFSYLLRTQAYRAWVVGSATGSTVKHTAPSRIESFRCFIPNIDGQRRIASALRNMDDKIDLNRRINQTLEAMAQAIFKSWFVDFDPVKAKIAAIEQGEDPLRAAMRAISGKTDAELDQMPREHYDSLAATAALFPDAMEESELGEAPRGWEAKPIGELVDTVGGSTPDTKNGSYWEPAEHFWTTPKDLSNADSPVLLSTERKVSNAGLAKISSGLLPAGTLLMSSRAPIGYLALTQVPLAINQGYIAMPPGGKLPPLYLLMWCLQNMDEIKGQANGSTFMEISKKAFRPIPALLPDAAVVTAFIELIGPVFEKIISSSKEIADLSELRDTLLPKLLSGELSASPVPEEELAL